MLGTKNESLKDDKNQMDEETDEISKDSLTGVDGSRHDGDEPESGEAKFGSDFSQDLVDEAYDEDEDSENRVPKVESLGSLESNALASDDLNLESEDDVGESGEEESDNSSDEYVPPIKISLNDIDEKEVPVVSSPTLKMESFEDPAISPEIQKLIEQAGWTTPTEIQAASLPYTLQGKDVAGFAQTGTGKTGVFLITLAQKFKEYKRPAHVNTAKQCQPFAVVLAPTRELAIQISQECEKILQPLDIKSLAIFGGMDWDKQATHLQKGVDIIVATPGRLKDFFQKQYISLKFTNIFVCDEVDRMFDMGFIEDVEFFFEKIQPSTQKLIFSATSNEKVKELAFQFLDNPEYISVHSEELTPEAIKQHALICEDQQKFKVLLGLIKRHNPERAIVFTNTKLTAAWLHYKLVKNHIEADLITGDLAQQKRIRLINRIKNGQLKILIATDVASRGLHIAGISHVYNFDIPDDPANYIHRIGRTARAGAYGESYTLVCEEYGSNFLNIQELLKNAVPNCEWPDEALLNTEDISGNPFEGEFGRNLLDRSPRDSRHFADRDDRRSRGSGHVRDMREHRNFKDQKFRRDDRDTRFQKREPNRQYQPAAVQKPVQQKQNAQPMGIFGAIKRFFQLLFGFGKKSEKTSNIDEKTLSSPPRQYERKRYDQSDRGERSDRPRTYHGSKNRPRRNDSYRQGQRSSFNTNHRNQKPDSRGDSYQSQRDRPDRNRTRSKGPYRRNPR